MNLLDAMENCNAEFKFISNAPIKKGIVVQPKYSLAICHILSQLIIYMNCSALTN